MDDLEFLVRDGNGSKVVSFPSTHFSVGSAPNCELRFEPALVKSHHAEVFRETDGTWWIRDTSGSGTVWVNGFTTLESKLEPGTFIKVGRLELTARLIGKSGPHGTMSTATPSRNVNIESQIEPERDAASSPDATFRRPSAVIAAEAASDHGNTNTGPSKRDRRHELQPGQIIDNRYKIVGKLAAGGMGEVYKAEHIELGKLFAIKVMLPELSTDADFVARFKREAIASSRIGQQNIVDISDFGRTQEGRFFFVMEYIEGRTLASTVRRDGPLTMQRVVLIGLQVARALAAAHQQSIVHRDLKPENVMLLQRPGQADFVKVLDFGIAKVSTGHGSGGQTAIGMVVGTPQYMSPEQAAGLAVDPRTDIYALGLILYELLSGRPTFVGETPSILMALQMTAAPPPLEPGPPKPVLSELEALVFHMLQKKVDARPASMEEVIGKLDEAMGLLRTATTGVATRKAAETNAALSALVPIVTQLPIKAPTNPKSQALPLVSASAVRAITGESVPAAVEASVSDDEAAGLKPNRTPLIIGLVLIAVVTAGTVVFFSRDSKPVIELPPLPPITQVEKIDRPIDKPLEKDPPVIAAKQVKFTFKSVPEQAEVFDADIMIGTTPFTITREKGQVGEFRFVLGGFKPATKKIRFEEDSSLSISLEKEKAKEPPKEAKEPRGPKPVGTKPAPKPLKNDPYGDVKELKDLPD
jgi:serine/threonine protein kinase